VTPFNFSGVVNLTADGVQNIPDATSSWNTNSINTSGSATLTVQTSATTPSGVYPVTMMANNGSLTRMSVGSVMVNTNVAVDPLIANFGNVNVGTAASPMAVTVYNAGTVPLIISSISITGATDFLQSNSCGASLAASSSCSVTLTFTPSG